jgi:hypothetical protein
MTSPLYQHIVNKRMNWKDVHCRRYETTKAGQKSRLFERRICRSSLLVIGFRQEDKSGLFGLLLSISSANNVSFVCRVYLSVVVVLYVVGCRASVVHCWLLIVECLFRLLLCVPGCRVSVVGCCLSVSVVAHFFRCRCPALKLTHEYVLNTKLENPPPSNYSSLKKVSSDVLCVELTTLAGTTRSFNPSLQHFERLLYFLIRRIFWSFKLSL